MIMTANHKPLSRAEQRAKRLAELQTEIDKLNAEEALEKSIADELATRGLARYRAAVQLYDVVGIGPVRRDNNDEKRAQRLVDEVTKLVEASAKPDAKTEVIKQVLARVERERDVALLTIARLRNVQGDREYLLTSARSIANEVMGTQQRPTPAA